MIRELGPHEVGLGFEAMRELRTQLTDEAEYPELVAAQMAEGYRQIASFEEERVVAIAGFRQARNLAWGSHLYIDDLSTIPVARGQGHASGLMRWIMAEALRLGVDEIHLDSGVQESRRDAHELYFRQGFRISSYHFSMPAGVSESS